MRHFILITFIFLSSINRVDASDKKTISVLQSIYSQALMQDDEIVDSLQSDTTIYVGVFNKSDDFVSIYTSKTNRVDVYIESISKNQYKVYFNENGRSIDCLNVRFGNQCVMVNSDLYILNPESYNKFKNMRSVLALSYLLIDCLGDYPKEILKLLNLNWGISRYQCNLIKAITVVQSPHSDMKYKYESFYMYDEYNEFVKIVQGDRYTRTLIKKDKFQIRYYITYNYGDRLTGESIQTINICGDEISSGSCTQVPTEQDFYWEQSYKVCKKYDTRSNMVTDEIYKIFEVT